MQLSLDLLEYNLEHKVLDYSYPEGQSNHFNNKIIKFLKKEESIYVLLQLMVLIK